MYPDGVRTTIELNPQHRAKLLELAARRGEKGFSSVIAEAIESHLKRTAENDEARRRADPAVIPCQVSRARNSAGVHTCTS